MKWMKRMLGMLLSMMILFSAALPAGAANGETTYTIRIYPGQRGSVAAGGECIEFRGRSYGDWISFTQNQIAITDTKYYIKGIRESGKDNNTATQNPSFEVTGDRDYVVAYGLLNDAVAYTINYQNLAGEALAPSETYYGNVGDKPVIAFMYIDGYQPQAYNLTKTLSENAAENVFTFVYLPVVADVNVVVIPATPVPTPVVPDQPPVVPEPVPAPVPVPEPIDIPDNPVPLGPFRPAVGDIVEQILNDWDVPQGNPEGIQTPEDLVDLDDQDVPQSSFGGDGSGEFSILNGNAFLVWIPMPVKICLIALFVLIVALGVRGMVKAKARKKK